MIRRPCGAPVVSLSEPLFSPMRTNPDKQFPSSRIPRYLKALLAASSVLVGSCEKQSKDQPPNAPAEKSDPQPPTSAGRMDRTQGAGDHSQRNQPIPDAVTAFMGKMAGKFEDRDAAMTSIDARLAELPSDEDRTLFVNLLVRRVPHNAYVLRWDMVEKHIASPGLRVGLLGMVLRDSLPEATDWVIARIEESEDPELCRRGVNSTFNFIFDSVEPGEIPAWLAKAFTDDELFNMGLDFWLTELECKNVVGKYRATYEQLLENNRIDKEMKSQLRRAISTLPKSNP